MGKERNAVWTLDRMKHKLRNYAGWYLQRWPTSEKNLERVMIRRARKYLEDEQPDFSLGDLVRDELAVYRRLGLVDDRKFARDRTRIMTERGSSPRKIESWLRARGCSPEAIAEAIDDQRAHLELRSVLRYARRRRLGPWSKAAGEEQSDEERFAIQQKSLGKMARAGHSFGLAKQALAMDLDEAMDILFDGRPD